MATRITVDLVKDLNNAGSYCNPFVQLIACPEIRESNKSAYAVAWSPHDSSREIYLAQAPILLPRGAKRMVWTADVRALGGPTSETAIDAITLYLSSHPYLGPRGPTAFDPTVFPVGYMSRTVALSIDTTTSETAFADDSGTGFVPPYPAGWQADGKDFIAYLTATLTGFGAGESSVMAVDSLTAWFKWE